MTQEEQRLADDRMRAEIANLFSEAKRNTAASEKLSAEIAKTIAETAKIKTERAWIPITVTAAATAGAMAAVTGLIQVFA